MVGARTVATDNPALTTRDFPGKSPRRVIYDPNGKLNESYKVFHADGCDIYYYSLLPNSAIKSGHIRQRQLHHPDHAQHEIMQDLFEQQMGIVLIEGGPSLQKQFIRQNLWDEAWVVQTKHPLDHGLESPNVHGELIQKRGAGKDTVIGIRNKRKAETG
jgi:diaminohydroxyphosphoribosylaminopyrimidine deaminase/5-amino-6-(5-phosphoribosylamino)uracil reductase